MSEQTKLLIDSSKDLADENYELVEDLLLTDLESYLLFCTRTEKIFRQVASEFPIIEIRPYQWEYAAVMCLRKRNIMAYEMGAGKTTCTLLCLQAIYGSWVGRNAATVHIVVPSVLSAQRWLEDLGRFSSMAGCYKLITNEKELIENTKPIIIYTQDFPKSKSKVKKDNSRPWVSRLLGRKFRPSFLVIDEVHNCQPKTKRTEHLQYLIARSKRLLVLSGTISEGRIVDVHNLCKLVYGKNWPFSTRERFTGKFAHQHVLSTNYLYGSRLGNEVREVQRRSIQQLNPLLLADYYWLVRRFIHRVKLTDPRVRCCITVPREELVLEVLEPSEEQRKQHQEYIREKEKEIEAAVRTVGIKQKAAALRIINPLIELANSSLCSNSKVEKTYQIVTQSTGKVVIFASYIKSANRISAYLTERLGSSSVVRVYATDEEASVKKQSIENRILAVEEFQFNPNVKVGVFAINLASESIDLTSAKDVIYYCLPWSSKKLRQSINRVVRPGNYSKTVNVHLLYHRGLIDEHQVSLATEKIRGSRLIEDYEVEDRSGELEEEYGQSDIFRKLLERL